FFPMKKGERVRRYIWARTIACPGTGKPVPLSPNWWLQKGNDPIAVRLLAEANYRSCRFEIVHGREAIQSNPDQGTISRGTAISPWSGDTIDGDYIKGEAQAGRMGQQLYALSVQTGNGYEFRSATDNDLRAIRLAEKELESQLPKWEAKGLIPREPYPEVSTDPRPIRYGMRTWADFFSPRQLLALGTYLEVFHDVMQEVRKELSNEMADAVQTYLAFATDKACDHNSRMARWESTRNVIKGTFDRHDFSFKWSHAEMNLTIPGLGFDWALSQINDAYSGISNLAKNAQSHFFKKPEQDIEQRVDIVRGLAQDLSDHKPGSIDLICVDPPYYDNVMYSECSDFFYVWMKRTLGSVYPQFFTDELTDKDNEAVA
ncbi:DUF1156 domain-containing protein, partial [bacterium]|nr:DUF1156 domain-containing protein [bacterium]